MEIDRIIGALRHYTGSFPRYALQQAISRKIEITPVLLSILKDARRLAEVRNANFMAHIYAMFLLAQFREKRAYKLIVDFFSLPGESAIESTADLVTEYLPRILASVAGGETALIKSLAENKKVDEYVRGAALEALVTQVVRGDVARDDVMAYFSGLFRSGFKEQPPLIWAFLVSCCADLYPEEVMGDIKQAYTDGLVDEMYIDYPFVVEALAHGKESVLRETREYPHRQYVDDTVKEMESWACFHRLQNKHRLSRHEQTVQPDDRFQPGRNDPCPCGSGLKYKKCCGR